MQHLQSLQYLLHDIGAQPLRYFLDVLIDDIGECSPVHILNKHEQAIHVVVRGLIVDDVFIGAHGHDCRLDLDLMQDLLLGHFHHSHCPALIGILPVEGLVDGAHGALAELLSEPIDLIGIFREEIDLLDLFVELVISKKGIVRYFFFGLQSGHDLDHHLRVVLDHILADVVLAEQLHHIGGESLDAAGAVEVHLQVHLVLEVLGPEWGKGYLPMKTGWELMRSRMLWGRSVSGRTSLERCFVLTVLLWSMFMGRSQLFTHYSGTPSSLPVMGFLVILTPGMGIKGLPCSNFCRSSAVSWFGSNIFWFQCPISELIYRYYPHLTRYNPQVRVCSHPKSPRQNLPYILSICCCLPHNRYIIMNKIAFLALAIVLLQAAPAKDKMTKIPGYPSNYSTAIYSGYLDVKNASRALHYLFVESVNGANNKDPITIWLNGGPGCSSLLGFLQEIGPYYLEDGIDYKVGDNLTENKYSWHKISNLLFLESPAGVGFSYNLDKKYQYNDYNTANDAYNAVVDFFVKFPEYTGRRLFIAGESYAGKYIPDLAVQIDLHNLRGEGTAINLLGIIVGNGVMSFDTLQRSTFEYMIDRKFVDPEIVPIYQSSCQTDPESAGCRFFEIEYNKGTEELNPYNVYGYCYYNDSFLNQAESAPKREFLTQESILNKLKQQFSPGPTIREKYNGAPCAFFDGIHDYFHLNEVDFNVAFEGQTWNGPCAENITYHIDPSGSMASYRYLLALAPTTRKISIILYNGNWDAVVPYVDTLKNIKRLNLVEVYTYNPWFTEGQHSGFEQIFSGLVFITFKGASHQVPQTKRAEAYNVFDSIIAGHNAGTIFEKGVFGRE